MAAHTIAIRRTRAKPRSRRIKITRSYYEYQVRGRGCPLPPPVPLIRLKGYWIELAGFKVGDYVRVEIGRQKITVVPAE